MRGAESLALDQRPLVLFHMSTVELRRCLRVHPPPIAAISPLDAAASLRRDSESHGPEIHVPVRAS